jgi:hypothetical protein
MKEDEEEDMGSYLINLRKGKERILYMERGSTRSHLWRTRFGRGRVPNVRPTTLRTKPKYSRECTYPT